MSRSLHTGVTKRRPKNRDAAHRASASLAGAPIISPAPDPSLFDIVPVGSLPRPRRKPGQPKLPAIARTGAILRLPGKQVLTQRPYLPPAAQPGVTALQAFLNTRTHGITEGMADLVTAGDSPDDSHGIQWNMSDPLLSRHHRRRIAQHINWESVVYSVPMYRLYLAQKHGGTPETDDGLRTCTCARKGHIPITLVELSGPTHSTLEICGCTSAAERLLPKGYFPCAPRRPSLAFSTSLLDLISIHSLHVAPNTTAWARTLESFWARRGPVKRATGSLRKRLGMALTWYQVLDNRAEDFVTQCLPENPARKRPRQTGQDADTDEPTAKRARRAVAGVDAGSPQPVLDGKKLALSRSGAAEGVGDDARLGSASSGQSSTPRPRASSRSGGAECVDNDSRPDFDEGAKTPAMSRLRRDAPDTSNKRLPDEASSVGCSTDAGEDVSAAESLAHSIEAAAGPRAASSMESRAADSKHDTEATHTKHDASGSNKRAKAPARDADKNGSQQDDRQRPSPRLRRICPLCFGGDMPSLRFSKSHVLVCIDANFAQKRRKSSQTDAALTYAGGRFAEDSVVTAMEAEVAAKRAGPANKRRRGPNIEHVSDDVLDECERSFIAAQEGVTKASKNYYADTGLMALLCRHDRVLLLVNLTTPGERQHYALALLRKLALELPKTWNIGVLYDIACQVSRSIAKWGLLPELKGRLSFAVSVFHAYGHQWECQIVFHPRKRDGFGLTDGEGCERFWSSIRHLIAALRVSGYHRRLFVLDRQVHALDVDGMWNFALWLRKRFQNAQQRLADAESILAACGETEAELGAQWSAQVAAQLEKHRQSKSAADKMLNKILEILGTIDGLRQDVKDDRNRLRKARKVSATEAHTISLRIDETRREIESLQDKVDTMQGSLGTEQCRRLEDMRGSEYLRARVNARALRANIRQALVAHKFEHRKLERAYRHQLLQAKEHAQTKDLIHRRERNISSQVAKFNKLVDRMVILARDGYKPRGRVVMPRKLDGKKLFKLDIDDDIWQEDPGLGPQDEGELPRYIADPNVQRGMTALLEKRRCLEEVERLEAEVVALRRWWDEEDAVLRSVCEDSHEKASVRLAVKRRYDLHRVLHSEFEHELAYCTLGKLFQSAARSPSVAPMPVIASVKSEHLVGSGDETEDSTLVDYVSDDASDAYSDGDDEDEPEADWLDELQKTAGLARVEDDSDIELEAHSDVDEGDDDSSAECAQEPGELAASGTASHPTAQMETSPPATASATSGPAGTVLSKTRKTKQPKQRVIYLAGLYRCLDHDLERIARPHTWLSGDGLSTFLESERLRLGVTDASIVHSCTLFDVQIVDRNLKTGNMEVVEANMKVILSALDKLVDPRTARKWLILGHVEDPPHWTLIEVLWAERKIRFYDSRSRTGGYASKLEKKTRQLLKMWEDHVTDDLDVETFTWVGERTIQRQVRQFNGYDCGPFVAADAVSLLTSNSPSPLTQDDMGDWRRTMEQRVRALRTVEEIDNTKRTVNNGAVNVIEIDD